MSDEQDPRWEWVEVTRLGDPQRRYVKGYCNHLEVVPVESGGDLVAILCLTCDTQLPADLLDFVGLRLAENTAVPVWRADFGPGARRYYPGEATP